LPTEDTDWENGVLSILDPDGDSEWDDSQSDDSSIRGTVVLRLMPIQEGKGEALHV
jgi:hypothetical protein